MTLKLLPPPPLGPEGTTPLPRWTCHKTVRAAVIVEVDAMLAVLLVELPDGTRELRHGRPHMFAGRVPQAGDFYVEYDDGYRSVSPAGPFLAGYLPERQGAPVRLGVDEDRFTPDQLIILRRLWDRFCDLGRLAGVIPEG